MLTTPTSGWDDDKEMLGRWGLSGMGSFEEKRMAPFSEVNGGLNSVQEQAGAGLKPDLVYESSKEEKNERRAKADASQAFSQA